ncbi:hypothetical protein HW932_09625 [Allochromatium humboldtianum]|uniref:Uncharacterized protein n=1 Tax=Allochromatium humboldtianum TaxID=504901 RepID=A0A850RE80_9GAMM|nr:hypothetical protein [Allochromatium humboldtianum]NVZ09522.1 hypothetical protein [Allochromatium humboldtianum]
MFPTFNVDSHPELNPLVGSSLYETALNCASALRWLMAIDVERLSDKAAEDGLYSVINPILGALECAAGREEGCITLSAGDSKRLRALASEAHQGHIAAALNAAIDAAEILTEQETEAKAAAEPERQRRIAEALRAVADDVERQAKEGERPEPLNLDLSDAELAQLRSLAEQEGADLPRTAGRLLAAALHRHADAVTGGAQ